MRPPARLSRCTASRRLPMQDRSIRKLPGWRATLAAALTSLTAVVVLVACGGGGGGGGGAGDTGAPTTGTPSGATSYTLGTISSFGSVVVGGVRFDDSNAT